MGAINWIRWNKIYLSRQLKFLHWFTIFYRFDLNVWNRSDSVHFWCRKNKILILNFFGLWANILGLVGHARAVHHVEKTIRTDLDPDFRIFGSAFFHSWYIDLIITVGLWLRWVIFVIWPRLSPISIIISRMTSIRWTWLDNNRTE